MAFYTLVLFLFKKKLAKNINFWLKILKKKMSFENQIYKKRKKTPKKVERLL